MPWELGAQGRTLYPVAPSLVPADQPQSITWHTCEETDLWASPQAQEFEFLISTHLLFDTRFRTTAYSMWESTHAFLKKCSKRAFQPLDHFRYLGAHYCSSHCQTFRIFSLYGEDSAAL